MARTNRRLIGLATFATFAGLVFAAGVQAQDADPAAVLKTTWACKTLCTAGKKGEAGYVDVPLEYTSCATNSETASSDDLAACREAVPAAGDSITAENTSCANKTASCQ